MYAPLAEDFSIIIKRYGFRDKKLPNNEVYKYADEIIKLWQAANKLAKTVVSEGSKSLEETTVTAEDAEMWERELDELIEKVIDLGDKYMIAAANFCDNPAMPSDQI